MTTLYLAEKRSMGEDLARVLGAGKTGQGFIRLKSGDVVTWAMGHLLDTADPEAHNEQWGGRWSWEQLPMVPTSFKRQAVRSKAAQLKVIKDLLKDSSTVVIATDAGREGELIGREILEHCKFKGKVKRLWTSSLTDQDIRKALSTLRDGSQTEALLEAAKARQESDWIYGYSLTRAATLAAQQRGQWFPVGRVQTPTLYLVVKRELEIENFKSVTYYELLAKVRTARGHELELRHSPGEASRITDLAKAQRLVKDLDGFQGPLSVTRGPKREGPPLPYSLPKLQKDASRILGFSAATTLEVAQKLYERKTITYPRTDSEHLPESLKELVPDILRTLSARYPDDVDFVKRGGIVMRKSTFDDAKLSDHHGMIPTNVAVSLQGQEAQLYELIAQRFLQTLCPDHQFDETVVQLDARGTVFKTTGRVTTDPGWRVLLKRAEPE